MTIESLNSDIIKFLNKYVADLYYVNGVLDSTDIRNVQRVSAFASDFINEFGDEYAELVTEISEDIKRNINSTLAKARNTNPDLKDLKFDKASIEALLQLNVQELYNINSTLATELQSRLIQSIVIGLPQSDLMTQLEKYTDLNFKNKISTLYSTLENTYQQKTEDILASQIEFDGIWEYIGAPLQANSHKECVWALTEKPNAPYFTTKEKEEFEAGTYPPHLEGRSSIRYNCQHYFIMTDKKSL